MYHIDFDTPTKEVIRHLPPLPKSRIREAFHLIAKNPQCGKPLQEILKGLYSYRVGTLRIIYKINTAKKTVSVITIGPRRFVYEELEKSLSK